MNLDDKLNNKEAVKKKQNKTKKERERNKRKSFTIGYERNTQKTSAHSSSIHSQHIYWLRIWKKLKKAIVKRIFIGTINYETSFNRITDTGA